MSRCAFGLRSALAVAIGGLGLVAASFPATAAPASTKQRAAPAPGPQLVQEAKSKALCEAVPHRIFISHFVGTECIAFHATTAQPTVKATVIYFNGDVPSEYFKKPAELEQFVTEFNSTARFMAERSGVRIIFVARPGTFGSSGDHELRGEPREILMMNAAVDAIKARLDLTDIVLAGQSRGSQVAAGLLTTGRTDITCAVLGSGSLFTVENERQFRSRNGRTVSEAHLRSLRQQFYDPSAYVSNIPKDTRRRVFILGDRTDTITPFAQQQAYGERLREFGHHALTIEIKAHGREMHGATHLALPAATLCAKGVADEQIAFIVGIPTKPVARTAAM